MLPRALLFSCDAQATELILALLPEFGIEVEHCADVFGAVEKLTSRSFHAIVVDWKESLEASFLLKTARELTSAKATSAVAIVDQRDASAALSAGASAVLVRPLSFEQARSTFSAALPQLPGQLPPPMPTDVRQAPSPTIPSNVRQDDNPPAPRPIPTVTPSQIVSRVYIPKPPSFSGYARKPRRPAKHRSRAFHLALLGIGGIAILLASDTVRSRAESALRLSQSMLAIRLPFTHAQPASDAAAIPDSETGPEMWAALQNTSAPSLRVETRVPASSHGRRVSRPSLPVETPSTEQEVEAQVARPQVPQSLMVPIRAMTRSPEVKLSGSQGTRWSLEPVLLPENVSREMVVRQVLPKYPEVAVTAGLEGPVTLHAMVGKDGAIRDLKLIHGSLILGRSAYNAVKQWRYKPYQLNGTIVEMQTFITVNFTLTHTSTVAQKLPLANQ